LLCLQNPKSLQSPHGFSTAKASRRFHIRFMLADTAGWNNKQIQPNSIRSPRGKKSGAGEGI
jgi:hypothetical protein